MGSATVGSKHRSNLDSLLLALPPHVFVLAALRQALGEAAPVLQLGAAVRLGLALVLCNARGANITCTASRLADTNTVSMKPLLATNAADHEPENEAKAAQLSEIESSRYLRLSSFGSLPELIYKSRHVPVIALLTTDAG